MRTRETVRRSIVIVKTCINIEIGDWRLEIGYWKLEKREKRKGGGYE